jgi:hypothetical protein
VESTVLSVRVLEWGTGSPGASLMGLPRPAVAAMGAMLKLCASVWGVSAGGVMGKAPGMDSWDLVFSDSLGMAPASAAVLDVGAADERVLTGSSTMSSGSSTLLTMPWPSSSLRALSLMTQSPLTTNCGRVSKLCASQPQLGGSCAAARRRRRAHLVLSVDLGQLDRLLENAVDLLQGDGLLPVVKGARDEDVVRSVLPRGLLAGAEPTYVRPCSP